MALWAARESPRSTARSNALVVLPPGARRPWVSGVVTGAVCGEVGGSGGLPSALGGV